MTLGTEIKVRVTTTKDHKLTLTGDDLINILKENGYDIPAGSNVTLIVPDGDWSGEIIDIDKDTPIKISWSTTDCKETDS